MASVGRYDNIFQACHLSPLPPISPFCPSRQGIVLSLLSTLLQQGLVLFLCFSFSSFGFGQASPTCCTLTPTTTPPPCCPLQSLSQNGPCRRSRCGYTRTFFSHMTTKLVYSRTRLLCAAWTLSHFFLLRSKTTPSTPERTGQQKSNHMRLIYMRSVRIILPA